MTMNEIEIAKGKEMNKITTSLLVIALFLLGVQGIQAQPVKYAQAGMGFLKIDVGSRIAAMGGTHASVSGTALDMFANPAGLALVQGFDVMASSNSWIADISHYGLGAAYNLGNVGTFGLNLVWMDYGEFTRTVPVDDLQGFANLGTFNVNEFAIGLSYARRISSQFFVGGNIRYAEQDLGRSRYFR